MSKKRAEDRPDEVRRSLLRGGLAASSWTLVSRLLGRGPLAATPRFAQTDPSPDEDVLPGAEHVPSQEKIYRWIEDIYEGGIRRPAYPADRRAEELCARHFREAGLENVRLEPLEIPHWEPRSWSLVVHAPDGDRELPCFPLPHTAPTPRLRGELAAWDDSAPEKVRGKIALDRNRLLRLPASFPVAGLAEGSDDPELAIRLRAGGRIYDPRDTLDGATQVLPFGPRLQGVADPAIEAGAAGFVGVLDDYPGDSHDYYVPYDGIERPIPGVWIRGSDGDRLRALLGSGPVRVTMQVDSLRRPVTSHNVLGELPGRDEELVVIGSHHDGPWASAVEDASGTALVMAQASYWAAVPRSERPHRLVFLVNAGHMVGGAGCRAFLERHAAQVERIVLEVHLEHAAREIVEQDRELVPSGLPEPRWWFTSPIPPLEEAVWSAIRAEGLERSLLVPPDVFAPVPTTDGGAFHLHSVPLVNFLTAPFYLFDSMDTMDKIHPESLEPVTRTAIRIIRFTRDVSAAAMRSQRRS